jgi:DNA repair exonuclease SbcCD ATPase subunit
MNKQDKWAESFQQASDKVSQWREKHPRANFTDIENTVDEQLARVRVAMIQDMALESEMTNIKQLAPEARPKCPGCGRPLAANGKQSRQLITNHEQSVTLERSKGYCRHCGVSFFPPG